jgi:hypothetical protein
MSRRTRVVDTPHHVTQRGNGRQVVSFADKDREVYLDAFFDYAGRWAGMCAPARPVIHRNRQRVRSL